ncbi:MAG: molybdopterin-dependent oxidoreductase [Fimbriimonadaceae bacterium]|nr:molybdopterin-dependent oxidoreductase [Fimbriimonadaceae bacterium]
MSSQPSLSRRTLLKVTAGAGAGLVLGCYARPTLEEGLLKSGAGKAELIPSAWLRLDSNGIATVTISKSDMGQGARTVLATLVAEELDIPWENVRVEQADGDREKYGSQGTGGSSSVRSMWGPLRLTGATARTMLVAAAAQKWGVPASECHAENGKVSHPGPGREAPFGELVELAATLPVPDRQSVQLKSPEAFKLVGKRVGRIDARDIAMGKAQYASDLRPKGAAVAAIARPPAFGARAKSFDDSRTMRIPGVRKVVEQPSGIAVVADHTWAALEGRRVLEIDWDMGPNADLDSAKIRQALVDAVGEFPAVGGAKSLRAEYDLPFLSHSPLEPMNCIADVKADSAELWAPTQGADGVRSSVAQTLGLPLTAVTVHVPMIGGGFGRRLQGDYATEAALLSKAIGGPVQVIWSRDDDMRHDFYRPTSHHALMGAVDAQGMPVAWLHQMMGPSGRRGGGDFSRTRIAYDVANVQQRNGGANIPVPTGAWRSVGASQTCFVEESFFDELAHLGGQDPLELRLKLLQDPRLKKCVETVKEKAQWGREMPKGSAQGVACFAGFGSYVAVVAEVTVRAGEVKVDRVVEAIDCGVVVSPSGASAQAEGCVVDGISTALHAGITIANGGVEQSSYFDYPWIKIADMPNVEVHFIEGANSPGGMGEPTYPPVPPALMNAIFAATGKRIRRLPMQPGDLD